MKPRIDYIIIGIGIILLGVLISPLFKGPGLPLNIDLPAQYVRIMCLAEQGTAPNNWCPYINAGTPTSQYYYPVYDQLLAFGFKFSTMFGLQANGHPEYSAFFLYKLNLVLALLIPALAIWLWLKDKHPIGAAIGFTTYLVLTAGWHGSGFQETILVGFWHYMLSVGAMLISCYYFNRLLKDDSGHDIVWFLISLLFILHPMTIFTAAVCYLGLAIYNYKNIKENPSQLGLTAILSLGVTAFYWIPFIAKMSFFPSSVGAMLDWELFMGYIINPVFSPLFFIGAVGLYFAYNSTEDKPLFIMFLSLAIFTALDFIKSPLNKIQIGVRIGAFLIPVVIMLYSLAIDFIYNFAKKKKNEILQYLTIILAIGIIFYMFFGVYKESKYVILSTDTPIDEYYEVLADLPPGRILMEDTLPVTGSHVTSLMPILTKRDIISFGPIIFPKYNLLDNTGPSLFNTNVEDWTEKDLKEVFTRYNIKWALVYSPNYVDLLKRSNMNGTVYGPFILFDTNIKESYFEGPGQIDRELYKLYSGYVYITEPGTVKFKVNYYPNWKAHIGNKELKTYACDGIICADTIEAGKVEFVYSLTWSDIIGQIITAMFIMWIIFMFIPLDIRDPYEY
jgi:hypothetical protein